MNNVKLINTIPINPLLVLESANKAYNSSCSEDKWTNSWDWLFNRDNAEDNAVGFYIQINGVVASFVMIVPLTISNGKDHKLKAGLAIWGLTHPDYQGKGYYSDVYRFAERYAIDAGYDCLIAFDNHNSHYPEVKYLNWRDIGLLTSFTLKHNEINPIKDRDNEYRTIAQELDEPALEMISHFDTNNALYSIDRNYSFLKWRLLDHPHNKYFIRSLYHGSDILACAIYKEYQDTSVDIMELFYKNSNQTENLHYLHYLIEDIALNGLKNVNIWSNLISLEHLALEKIGFEERGFSAYFVCNKLNMQDDILDLRNWHYRFMDSDVY